MACNSCAKPYTLFRKEKGCPGCGFSYCAKCLNHTIFVTKLNSNAKVCSKCSKLSNTNKPSQIEPPDAYYKLAVSSENENTNATNKTDQEIKQRLQILKDLRNKSDDTTSEDKIQERLKNLKGCQPSTSDAELEARLANLRGLPITSIQKKPVVWTADLRTEQEQADDLLKCYLEQAKIDQKYRDGFDKNIDHIAARIQKLKGDDDKVASKSLVTDETDRHSEDEETEIKKIIEKVKAESLLDSIPQSTNEELAELPFCEICNEDANMRCLGCRYLFCKRCFMDHKDDDDGCNKYELYTPPNSDINL